MKFKTQHTKTKNEGQKFSKMKKTYAKFEDPITNEITLKENGQIDIYAIIQEYADEANINKQLEIVDGTPEKYDGEYKEYDLTKIPKNLIKAKKLEKETNKKLNEAKKNTEEKRKKAMEEHEENKIKKEKNEN